ncbi:MAG: hypothetical protein WC788_01775 [Candidatus Paceibacterota bacterium]|jgi:hypothetical protein
MIKIEEKTDKGYFAALRELLELYKKGAKEGMYYKILPQDIMAEGISFEGRETLSSEEEGLRELARVIYYAATGIWEYNDPSIKLDGYPKIDSMMWPVLEMMLSKDKPPDIKEIEKKIKDADGVTSTPIKVSVEKITGTQTKSIWDLLIEKGCFMTGADSLLQAAIGLVQHYEESVSLGSGKYVWMSMEEDHTLFKMLPGNSVGIGFLQMHGLIDISDVAEIGKDWNRFWIYTDTKSFIMGLEKLKSELSGKKAISITDNTGSWYLKVC